MTDAQRRTAIKELIRSKTAANTESPKAARDFLIAEGIYTKTGKLTARYGGKIRKKRVAA